MPHDPERQAGYIRQALTQGRRPLGFLLGAGCPVSIRDEHGNALIPDIAGLTENVRTDLSASDRADVWAILEAQLAANSNVEAILSHIRSLRVVAGADTVRGLSADDLDALDAAICTTIVGAANKQLPTSDTPYHKLASWVGSSIRAYPVELFTPNYDLLLEQALEAIRVPYFDGFVGSVAPFFDLHAIEADELPRRWARLWKLHGSINWSLGDGGTVYRIRSEPGAANRVIYPSHLKYEQSRRMPYLAFLDRLKSFLRNPSAVLVTCGYSFRDQHLNEVLLDGAEGNPSSMVFGLLHGSLADYDDAIRLAMTRANLTIMADDGAVVGTRHDTWITADGGPPTHTDKESVAWTQADDASPFVPELRLGDFQQLGLLLAGIMGERETAVSNAE